MAEDVGPKLRCSLYISPNPSDQHNSLELGDPQENSQRNNPKSALENLVQSLDPDEPWQITETSCGLIVSFSSESDAERLLSIDLAVLFGRSVQVAYFSSSETSFRQALLLHDVPEAIPLQDISDALAKQGIAAGSLKRIRQHVRVEVLDASEYELLLQKGLDFFEATRFTAVPERWWHGGNRNGFAESSGVIKEPPYHDGVLQCYRCQGFWHMAANCHHLPRCVRCGEPHSVKFCPRPRHDPVCCHCSGPHHAAYRQCPVRLQLLNATPISITLSSVNSAQARKLWIG